MRLRIEKHRQVRPAGWRTLEVQRHVGQTIMGNHDGAGAIMIDCLTVLISNRVLEFGDPFSPEVEAVVREEADALAECARSVTGASIVVSNEVGVRLVPPNRLGRASRDLLGKVNQMLAARANRVVLLVAGLPVELRGGKPGWQKGICHRAVSRRGSRARAGEGSEYHGALESRYA